MPSSLKIPPHLKLVATLPYGSSIIFILRMTFFKTHRWRWTFWN